MNPVRIACAAFLAAFLVAGALGKPPISDELKQKIMEKQGIDAETLERYLPYVYPPADGPVAEGLNRGVPQGLGNQRLADMGLLDVTAAPFEADPSGRRDSTRALQEAVDFARDNQMAAFFPPGTYRVSDTLEYIMDFKARGNGRLTGAHSNANILIGSTKDPSRRAEIYLAPNSPGFGDETNPKIVVHILKRAYDKGWGNFDSGESMNQMFRDIDIRIGEGNRGATGIRMTAAEGSSIQNITIDATHGYAGMRGLAGGGGSHHGITILGGKIGIDTQGWLPEFPPDGSGTQVTPTMAGVSLIGQTEAALVHRSRGPLVGVGWKIEFAGAGPAIRNFRKSETSPFDSALCLIDSSIEYRSPTPKGCFISAERSFYLRNVFLRNCGAICEGAPLSQPGEWTRVEHYARPIDPAPYQGLAFDESPIIDGQSQTEPYAVISAAAPPADLQSRHLWPADFPSMESPGAANVKDAPYNASGDGVADDTLALQKAIDENEIVFLPRGYYRVEDSLRLKPNTKLVGVMHNLSIILAASPFGSLMAGPEPKPLVETADASDADTVIAFVGIALPYNAKQAEYAGDTLNCYALKWQCGGNSILRSPGIERFHIFGAGMGMPAGYKALAYDHPLALVTGNGGGKWYNFFIHGMYPETKNYRHLAIVDTVSPISIYHLHAQHAETEAQCEARNAAAITVYGMKSEHNNRFLRMADCDSVELFGFGGIATPPPGGSQFLFENVRRLLFACCNDQVNLADSHFVKDGRRQRTNIMEFAPFIDRHDGAETAIAPLSRPILYSRSKP